MSNPAKPLTTLTLLQSAVWFAIGSFIFLLVSLTYVGLAQGGASNDALVATLEAGMVKIGTASKDGALLVATADSRGAVGIKLPWGSIMATEYPLLNVRFKNKPENVQATVAWSTSTDAPKDDLVLSGRIDSSGFWLYLAGNSHWTGTVSDLKLVLRGMPLEEFAIESMSLEPLSAEGLILSNRFDWLSDDTWTLRSNNFFKVVPTGRGPLNPVSVVALLLLSALFTLLLWTLVTRQVFNLHVAGVIVVLGWIVLDGLWLGRLTNQVNATQLQFAGKPIDQRLIDGPDAKLFSFIEEVRQQLADRDNPRIFVASSGDYKGMRAAYYLYPHNVYWRRHGPELPDAEHLQPADYIVLVSPSDLKIDQGRSTLVLPDSTLLDVEPVLIRKSGMLLQVR